MSLSSIKGKSLENAVAAIEATILSTDSRLTMSDFTIECRKIIERCGVKHEIDVWVEVPIAKGMTSIFIFECRNRTKAADKNDIVVFSEKVRSAPAQAGYFVARSFTKDARAMAKQDSRLKLLKATEHKTLDIPIPFEYHGREVTRREIVLSAFKPGANGTKPGVAIDPLLSVIVMHGHQRPIQEIGTFFADQMIDEALAVTPVIGTVPGTYEFTDIEKEISFQPGEFTIDGNDIERIVCNVQATVKITIPKLKSVWDVESRGRVLTVDLAVAGNVVEAAFVNF